jgi:hypothetical protein
MPTQLLHPVKSVPVIPNTEKDSIDKGVEKETYIIYSIYYSNEPEGGHVVYASTKRGWEFFGDMPIGRQQQIAVPRLSRGKFSHL